ncbi:MAG: HD-GYP domain-containing protein [Actinomycetota bacterium]
MLNFETLEKVRNILTQLAGVKRKAILYPPGHASLKESFVRLLDSLNELFKEKSKITFDMFEEDLFFEQELLVKESIACNPFIRECEERDVGSISFLPGVEVKELEVFVNTLNTEPMELKSHGGVGKILEEEGVIHIASEVLRPLEYTKEKSEEISTRRRKVAREVYGSAVNVVREIMHSVKVGDAVHFQKAQAAVDSLIDTVFSDEPALLGLTTIKSYDEYTFYHSVNTCILTLSLGTRLYLNREHLSILGTAALLHDIGKVNIPLEIINKPIPLTPRETEIMKKHVLEGAEILRNLPGVHKLSMVVAYEHHARYDLSGYPKITNKQRPHIFSRVVQLTDSYDAGTSARPHQGEKLPDQVLAEMIRQSGTAFDPTLIKAFVQALSIYPVGSLVKLDTGEVCVVYRSNPDNLLRPKVKMIIDAQGNKIHSFLVDLSEIDEKKRHYKRTIVAPVDPQSFNVDATQYF